MFMLIAVNGNLILGDCVIIFTKQNTNLYTKISKFILSIAGVLLGRTLSDTSVPQHVDRPLVHALDMKGRAPPFRGHALGIEDSTFRDCSLIDVAFITS